MAKKKRTPKGSRQPRILPPISGLALQGPDGTLDGDVRALLLVAPDRLEERQERLREILTAVEQEWQARRRKLGKLLRSESGGSHALAMALWPWVLKLYDHYGKEMAKTTARADLRRKYFMGRDFDIDRLETLRAKYFHVESLSDPLSRALDALRTFEGKAPAWEFVPPRSSRGGNPIETFVRQARLALSAFPFLDKSQTGEILHLVGLRPLK